MSSSSGCATRGGDAACSQIILVSLVLANDNAKLTATFQPVLVSVIRALRDRRRANVRRCADCALSADDTQWIFGHRRPSTAVITIYYNMNYGGGGGSSQVAI